MPQSLSPHLLAIPCRTFWLRCNAFWWRAESSAESWVLSWALRWHTFQAWFETSTEQTLVELAAELLQDERSVFRARLRPSLGPASSPSPCIFKGNIREEKCEERVFNLAGAAWTLRLGPRSSHFLKGFGMPMSSVRKMPCFSFSIILAGSRLCTRVCRAWTGADRCTCLEPARQPVNPLLPKILLIFRNLSKILQFSCVLFTNGANLVQAKNVPLNFPYE